MPWLPIKWEQRGYLSLSVSYSCCNKLPQTQQLKATHFHILQCWKSEIQNGSQRAEIGRVACLSGDSRGESVWDFIVYGFLPFGFWPYSIFKASNSMVSSDLSLTLSLTLLPPSSTSEGSQNYTGPTWTIQDIPSISKPADQHP